jgi:hypothetical protein
MPDTRPSRLAALCPASSEHGCFIFLQTEDLPWPADLMMRHWVGEAVPELKHLHADAACGEET